MIRVGPRATRSRFTGCAPAAPTWPRQPRFPSLPSPREKRRKRGRPPLTRSKPSPARVRSSSAVTSVCSPRMTWRTISVFSRLSNCASENSKAQAKADDLDRWTAALGFCDLVSLFLLSAPGREAEFPLAHPSSPQAGTAPRVRMQSDHRNLRFTPEVVHPGCALSIQALRHPVPAQGPRAETLTWHVQ